MPYINHAILSINKSRSNKRHAGNLSSIINELKQIKEKILFESVIFMNYVTKKYHTIIIKKYQYNYDIISILLE